MVENNAVGKNAETAGAAPDDTPIFDKNYWEQHWSPTDGRASISQPDNPYLATETSTLSTGDALDAGCGTGEVAVWLARHGWRVTGADISGIALANAARRGREAGVPDQVTWVETDLTTWTPGRRWDLVVTSYAHPAIPQLDFYRRIADWVAPGGTLLIIGHRHDDHPGEPGHPNHPDQPGHAHHPREATATAEHAAALFPAAEWEIQTARENNRVVSKHDGAEVMLQDFIVCARRRSDATPATAIAQP